MKIVIKIGTQSILSPSGLPIREIIESIVSQISELHQEGHQIILVSSGAVGLGRYRSQKYLDSHYGQTIGEKQVLASIGQHQLIQVYSDLFEKNNLLVSQLLLTKQDFYTRQHYLNISRLLNELLRHKNIIPIVNENDTVAIEELMFTDNDELAGLLAAQINADRLIILSNVEGVYTKNPQEAGAEVIHTIDPEKSWPRVSLAKSTQGRGGMISKLSTAKKMSQLGIITHIASITVPDIIHKIMNNEKAGTQILAYSKKSSIKRWLAYGDIQKTGSIRINSDLNDLLMHQKKVLSLLPIGIQSCEGPFSKGDVVDILDPQHNKIGMGIAKYDHEKLQEYIGQKNKPLFMHYDHIYLL